MHFRAPPPYRTSHFFCTLMPNSKIRLEPATGLTILPACCLPDGSTIRSGEESKSMTSDGQSMRSFSETR